MMDALTSVGFVAGEEMLVLSCTLKLVINLLHLFVALIFNPVW